MTPIERGGWSYHDPGILGSNENQKRACDEAIQRMEHDHRIQRPDLVAVVGLLSYFQTTTTTTTTTN